MVDGDAVRSCVTPVARVSGRRIMTIEGLSGDNSHPVQKAWSAEQVAQCGYCQPGQMMSATALLASNHNPSDSDIDNALSGNLCRCGTYQRIRKAVHRAAEEMRGSARCMEPTNFTAAVTASGCEVWGPTQGQEMTQSVLSQALGLPREKVLVNRTYCGGGFGRRLVADFAPLLW